MTPDETAEQNIRNALTILLYTGGPAAGGLGRLYDTADVNAICARLTRAIAQLSGLSPRLTVAQNAPDFEDFLPREVTDHLGEEIG